jgi:hypothetical protein
MQKRGAKGQLSIFIIIGILILAIFVVYLVVQRTIIEDRTAAAQRIVEQVPTEFLPIQRYTDDCLAVVAERGLIRLGQQGGYIRPLDWHSLRADDENPTDADGIAFGDDIFVPYWLYNDAANRANVIELVTLRPTEEQMEQELERWIEEEIEFCLDNYNAFDEQGFSVEQQDTAAIVSIVPGKVNVQMQHEIAASREGRTTEMEHFYHELDVDMYQMLAVANNIYDAQKDFSFLEEHMLNVMTLFGGTSTDDLPPMNDATFELSNIVLWEEENVKKRLTQLLTSYVSLLQYRNSLNFYQYSFPSDTRYRATKQRIYNDMMLPLTGAENLDVRFSYLDMWNPYFDANARGGVIKPQSVFLSYLGINFGVQDFKTVYDVSYPVWVQLHNPLALNQQGFSFNFALEGNIRNNRAAEHNQVLPSPSIASRDSLLCDTLQRTSEEVTVVALDSNTRRPIPKALISFVLGDESCVIGQTDVAGRMTSTFPKAIGGVVHLSAQDYLGTSVRLNTYHENPVTVDAEMHKLKVIELTVKKKKILKCGGHGCWEASFGNDPLRIPTEDGWVFSTTSSRLLPPERALVSLTRVSELDDEIIVVTAVQGSDTAPIRIPAGKYQVDIQLFSDEAFVIPKHELACPDDGFGGLLGDNDCPPIPEVQLDRLPIGGLSLTEDRELLILDGDELYNADELILYGISPAFRDIPAEHRRLDDLDQLSKIVEYSTEYSYAVQADYR